MNEPDISLILPAYNEVKTIGGTISDVTAYFRERRLTHEIIVAADGDDGTRELVSDLGERDPSILTIGNRVRTGKGRSIREAVRISKGAVVGYADADNKVPIREFDKIDPWLKRGYEVVIGSRALRESAIERNQPLYRRLGSRGFSVFMQTVVGLPGIMDTQCGFKFFPRHAARELFRLQRIDGYMFDVEILALARKLGFRIQQVPIRWRDDGDSRLQLLRGNMQNVIDIFKIRLAHAAWGGKH